jgi:hypothetical protein
VWKAFMRGHNPLFMDQYRGVVFDAADRHAQWDEVRRALGQTRRLAERVNLAAILSGFERLTQLHDAQFQPFHLSLEAIPVDRLPGAIFVGPIPCWVRSGREWSGMISRWVE